MIEEFVIHKYIWGISRFNSQTLSVLSMDIIKQRILYKYKSFEGIFRSPATSGQHCNRGYSSMALRH